MMVVVMGICLLDYDFTYTARDGLRHALEGQTTVDGLIASLREFGESLLNGTPAEEQIPLPQSVPVNADDPQTIPEIKIPAVDGGESKSPVPELSAYPGP